LLLLSDEVADAVSEHDVRLVTEAFPDLDYNADGTLMIEAVKQSWDPERVASRALRVAQEGRIDASDGSDLEVNVPTICLHGDAPNAVEVARAVRKRLDAAGVDVVALKRILDQKTSVGSQTR
jgi:UPF0271 protein